MIKEAIDKIESLTKPDITEKDGVMYSDKNLHEYVLGLKPKPESIVSSTLKSVIDYVKGNLDNEKSYLIHVDSHNGVNVYGDFEIKSGKRGLYLSALFSGFEFRFDDFMDREILNIKLQTQFYDTEGRAELLSFIGNIKSETIKSDADDGTTQAATVKTGIVNVENKALPNPISLSPKRTFPEIVVESSIYVVRGMQGHRNLDFGIFEADGGQWKLNAINLIADYLKKELKGIENIKIIA